MDERMIFTTALEKTDAAARIAYLDKACGNDAELRKRVDELLVLHNEAGDFLEQSPFEPGRTEALYRDSSTTSEAAKSNDGRTVTEDRHPGEEVSLDFLDPSEQSGSLGRLAQYEITEIVGRGGMGIVLKGNDTKLNRVVAIKVLAPELASNPTARKRFLRESQDRSALEPRPDASVLPTHRIAGKHPTGPRTPDRHAYGRRRCHRSAPSRTS